MEDPIVPIILMLLALLAGGVEGTEFSFELPDRKSQCFFEEIEKGTKSIVDFQVISGGNFDVDIIITGPNEKELYSAQRQKYDTIEFTAELTGEHQICFSNEFSSFSHKVIYFELVVGNEPPLTEEMGTHQVALTQLETSVVKIHEALRVVHDYQTHHRLRESQGRRMAEHLNNQVQYWSLGEALLFVLVAFVQVFILRRFFAVKRTNI